MTKPINAPFPYFGGKKTVAAEVWTALGDVDHYIEPFFGSGAVLLQRPHAPRYETVNDADGLLANFWRAICHDPEAVAHHADWPVNEADLHARQLWLIGQRARITEHLMGDPDYFDAKARLVALVDELDTAMLAHALIRARVTVARIGTGEWETRK